MSMIGNQSQVRFRDTRRSNLPANTQEEPPRAGAAIGRFFTETLPGLFSRASSDPAVNEALRQSQFYGTGRGEVPLMPGSPTRAIAESVAPQMSVADKIAQMEAFQQAGRADQDRAYENRLAQTGSYFPQQQPSFDEFLAQYGGQFDGSPYDQAADYLLERRQAQLEAIQNMYNQYAQEAEANAARVADIYGTAQSGISETYGGAQDLTEAAYGSAQQQAADQLARLGIEAAAPTVVNPMALSQAEAVSNLIANEAAGRGAVERYGATGRDFASSMAQIAQQQAVEQQDRFTSQLADQLFELEMQRAQAAAAYDPYARAMQRLEAEAAYNQMINPQADPAQIQAEAEFLYRQEQDDVSNFQRRMDTYLDSVGGNLEERQLQAYEAALRDAQTGQFGPRLKAEADAYFAGQGTGR